MMIMPFCAEDGLNFLQSVNDGFLLCAVAHSGKD